MVEHYIVLISSFLSQEMLKNDIRLCKCAVNPVYPLHLLILYTFRSSIPSDGLSITTAWSLLMIYLSQPHDPFWSSSYHNRMVPLLRRRSSRTPSCSCSPTSRTPRGLSTRNRYRVARITVSSYHRIVSPYHRNAVTLSSSVSLSVLLLLSTSAW